MAALSDPRVLLAAWEAVAEAVPPARGALLVHAAGLVRDRDAALDLPVGDCARLALEELATWCGPLAEVLVRCGACGDELQVDVPLPALDVRADTGGARCVVRTPCGRLDVRAVTTRDLLAVLDAADPAAALLERCVRGSDGLPVRAAALDEPTLAALDDALERLAGPASTVLASTCPSCRAPVSAALDPPELLWQQVDAAAPTLLAEVAALAGAFGWSEGSVLALTATRRRAYLDLAAP